MSIDDRPIRASEAWDHLRRGGHEPDMDKVPSKKSAVATGDGNIRFALAENNSPRTLLPIPARLNFQYETVASSLSVKTERLIENGRSVRYISLACSDPGLEKVFGDVVDNIVERVASGDTTWDACIGTLAEFHRLFSSGPAIDTRTIRGLVGELLFLTDALDHGAEHLDMWTGPEKDRHDFRKGTDAFEVKTVGRRGGTKLRISSEVQLSPPLGGRLFLIRYALEKAEDGQHSVSSLTTEISRRLSNVVKFRDLLAAVGCSDPNSRAWNEHAFNLEERWTFRIAGDFPRIVENSFVGSRFPIGISSIEYDVDLAYANACRLNDDEFEKLMIEVLG